MSAFTIYSDDLILAMILNCENDKWIKRFLQQKTTANIAPNTTHLIVYEFTMSPNLDYYRIQLILYNTNNFRNCGNYSIRKQERQDIKSAFESERTIFNNKYEMFTYL